jgi:transposase
MITTKGRVSGIARANEWGEHPHTDIGFADTGYDSDDFVSALRAARAQAVIAPRSNRKTGRRYRRVRYRTRNIVERFFNRIKHFRRGCRRENTLAGHYLAFAALACAWGRQVRMCTGPSGTSGGVGAQASSIRLPPTARPWWSAPARTPPTRAMDAGLSASHGHCPARPTRRGRSISR